MTKKKDIDAIFQMENFSPSITHTTHKTLHNVLPLLNGINHHHHHRCSMKAIGMKREIGKRSSRKFHSMKKGKKIRFDTRRRCHRFSFLLFLKVVK
jgi:predicted metal-dependent hydrolase